MGNSGGKNRTHPGEDGPSPVLMDPLYGDIYDKDQHIDYDSGVRPGGEKKLYEFRNIILVVQRQDLWRILS